MFNETISDSLFDKFNNLSKNNTIGDRVINRITIVKDSFARINSNSVVDVGSRKFSLDSDGNSSVEDTSVANKLTLGISIIQGSDNNVYVKDLVRNGPGERNGVQIGDQVVTLFATLYRFHMLMQIFCFLSLQDISSEWKVATESLIRSIA